MSPHVSNWMQVTSNYLQVKTVDIKSQNSEMNITWTEDSKTVSTGKTYKPNNSFCSLLNGFCKVTSVTGKQGWTSRFYTSRGIEPET